MDESNLEHLQKPLEHFRAKTKRLKIHPRERAVLWVVCLHLVFLPWAIGGMRVWAQWISLGLAFLGFGLALIPRNYTEEHTGSNRFRLLTWPKLLKFPLFWLGLALLGVVLIQVLNPAWEFKTDGKGWWMAGIPHQKWLPTGVDVPFERWGPWRMLLIYGSGWLTVCSIWVGLTRRRSAQVLFTTIAVNGLVLGVFGVAQALLGNGKMFWFWTSPNGSFFSSFVYKNHAGAYLILALATTCGLAAWYYLRGLRRMEKSNPSGVLAFFATCIAVSILTSYARGATLVMLVFLLVCVIGFVLHQFAGKSEHRKPVVAVALILIFGYFLKTGMETLRSQEAWHRIKSGITRADTSLESREQATRASMEMVQENWQRGVGAGSFRFIFPIYQHRHPELVKAGGMHLFWEHAHNDVLQFPIELGLAGMLILALGAGYLLTVLVRSYFWENPLSLAILFGAVLLVIYAWWDFPFQCPAVLITWCGLVVSAAMWTRFEELNVKG